MKYYACDTETTGLDFTKETIRCFGYWSPGDSGVLENVDEIRDWLNAHQSDCLIWHNGKFDQKVLRQATGVWPANRFDTLLAASLLPDRPERIGLGYLIERYLGIPSHKEDAWKKDIETCKEYCLLDCELTYKIAQVLTDELNQTGNYEFYTTYILPASELLAKAEYRGVLINKQLIEQEWKQKVKEADEFDKELREKYKDLISEYQDSRITKHLEEHPNSKRTKEQLLNHKDFKFNFSSPKQRQWLLKDKLGFSCEVSSYKAGKKHVSISTKAEVIEDYLGQHPIIEDLLTIQKLSKQEQDTYKIMEFIGLDGKIHANFNLHIARTGRLSSSGPNLQQVPNDEE